MLPNDPILSSHYELNHARCIISEDVLNSGLSGLGVRLPLIHLKVTSCSSSLQHPCLLPSMPRKTRLQVILWTSKAICYSWNICRQNTKAHNSSATAPVGLFQRYGYKKRSVAVSPRHDCCGDLRSLILGRKSTGLLQGTSFW